MAGKFNFTTKLGLDSAGFKQGVNKVRASLGSLKSSFLSLAGALGAGLGFTQLISNLKDTATQLSVAKNTLENVSRVTKTFGEGTKAMTIEINNYKDNLAFVKKLSEDYGQDLVSLMTNFAQFTSACQKTDLALEDQRKVYEALTRSAAYFHMSADRTKDMMNAVTQMMSKGKVAAEELRRQLGNSLPGAFNIMAASLDMTNQELDAAMRNGEVIAAEVLPKFAAMLNRITQDAHFDSLQTSLNKFKNAWYSLVDNSGAEDFFKKIVDGSTSVVKYIGENINGLLSTIKAFVVTIASYKLFKGWQNQGEEYLANQHKNLKLLEKEYQRYLNKFGFSGKDGKMLGVDAGDIQKKNITNPEDLRMIKQYNETLLKIHTLKQEIHGISMLSQKDIADIQAANSEIGKMLKTSGEAGKSFKLMDVAAGGILNIFKTIGATLKSWGIMAIVSAIIGGVTKIVSHVKEIRKEWERINNLFSDYEKRINEVDKSNAMATKLLNDQYDIVADTTKSDAQRLGALQQINETLGNTGDKLLQLSDLDKVENGVNKIKSEVDKWNEKANAQANIQKLLNEYLDAEIAKNKKLEELKKKQKDYDNGLAWNKSLADAGATGGYKGVKYFEDLKREMEQINTEITKQQEIMDDAQVKLNDYNLTVAKLLGGDGQDKSTKTKLLNELLEQFKKDKEKLQNQLKEHAITQEQFNEELEKLVEEYWKNAAAVGEMSIKNVIGKMNRGETLSALEKWYYNLSKDAAEAVQKALINGISEEIMKNIDKEIEEAADALEKELQKELEKEQKDFEINAKFMAGEFKVKPAKKRKSLFDYSKSAGDVLGEEFGLSDDWFQAVSSAYKNAIKQSEEMTKKTELVQKELNELSAKFRYAANEAKTLEAAMNYQKIVDDIKNLQKEINTLVYTGVKDLATSVDRVVSAADTLSKTMKDEDASGWEKFMAVFNLITQVTDTALGIYNTLNQVQELYLQKESVKIAEQTALNALLREENALRWEAFAALQATQGATAEEIANRFQSIQALFQEKGIMGALNGLKKQEAAQTIRNTALKGTEAAASTAAASAAAGDAVASATASGAKMPFPYNLIAIAGGIAAVVGALALMGKFEKGGIVGGNSTHGDRNIARVNSGEMILNKAQQGTLWSMLNGKGGMGGNVEFKIRGADLVGTINNYSSRKRG
jgi:tape measure domain-containing protein